MNQSYPSPDPEPREPVSPELPREPQLQPMGSGDSMEATATEPMDLGPRPMRLPAIYLPGWADTGGGIAPLASGLCGADHEAIIETLFYADESPHDFAAAIDGRIEGPTILIGWSLGGMVAIEAAARYPDHIAGIILLSASLQFCSDDRLHGWPPRAVHRMRKACEADALDTVDRFRRGLFTEDEWQSGAMDEYLGHCQDHQASGDDWGTAALLAGLDYLATADLRAQAQDLDIPVLWLHGDADTVCPIGAMRQARIGLLDGHWDFHELPDAGHAIGCTARTASQELILNWPPWRMICGDW